MKQKVKRTLNICTLELTLEQMINELDYARKQIPDDVNSKDVWLTLQEDDNFRTIVAEYESLETDYEEKMREQEEEFYNQFVEAKKNHLTTFTIDCDGSMEKVSIAARLVTKLRYSQNDCIVSGSPVFADEFCEKQTGIEVTIRYYSDIMMR